MYYVKKILYVRQFYFIFCQYPLSFITLSDSLPNNIFKTLKLHATEALIVISINTPSHALSTISPTVMSGEWWPFFVFKTTCTNPAFVSILLFTFVDLFYPLKHPDSQHMFFSESQQYFVQIVQRRLVFFFPYCSGVWLFCCNIDSIIVLSIIKALISNKTIVYFRKMLTLRVCLDYECVWIR